MLGLDRLVGIADRRYPNRSFFCLLQLLPEEFHRIDLHVHEFPPWFFVAGVPAHKKSGITVPAVHLTACVGIETIIEDFRSIQDAFCANFSDNHLDPFGQATL